MATHQAIAAIGKSIVGLLEEKCPQPEFTGAKFKLCQSSNFVAAKRPPFGISLHLFRVSINTSQRTPTPPIPPDGRRHRPPLTLDLCFLLTAWAKTPARQQDLLGWAMCVLDENPILPASVINQFAGGSSAVLRPEESVQLVPEILDFAQMKAVADLVQVHQQPSMVYLARPVLMQLPDK